MDTSAPPSRRWAVIGAVALAVVVVLVVVVGRRSPEVAGSAAAPSSVTARGPIDADGVPLPSSSSVPPEAVAESDGDEGTGSAALPATPEGPGAVPGVGAAGPGGAPGGQADPIVVPSNPDEPLGPGGPRPALKDLPLDVTVGGNQGTGDGRTITVTVRPDAAEAKIYGVEARLCRGGLEVVTDADVRPTQTGGCISQPLSSSSDDFVEVAVPPPYASAEVTFRAGVGTDRFTTQDGRPVAITCGPGSPCTLALKLQVPGGFGFRTFPVVYG